MYTKIMALLGAVLIAWTAATIVAAVAAVLLPALLGLGAFGYLAWKIFRT
jgi:hypothetical protein